MRGIRSIVIGLVGTLFSVTVAAEIPAQEREALVALYQATDGDNWVDKTGWLGAVGTECSWFGVRCNRGGNDYIERLQLGSNGLKGSIPAELIKLSQLRSLRLAHNELAGTIPKEFGEFNKLTSLTLQNNQLEGEIPKELGQLKLAILFLPHNKLTGEIPVEIRQIDTLKALGLNDNMLTGTVLDKIANIGQLMRLQVHNNCLDVESEFNQFPPEADNIIGLDLGNQGKCENRENIPLITTGYSYDIDIPSIVVDGQVYKATLSNLKHRMGLDELPWIWKVSEFENTSTDIADFPVIFDAKSQRLIFEKVYHRAGTIEVMLHRYQNPDDENGIYFQYLQ